MNDEENGGDISAENTLVVIGIVILTIGIIAGAGWLMWLKSQVG